MKLDNDFLKIQTYANQLFDSLPVVKEYKSDKDLIAQLQYSCVCYGRKLVSLFDKYTVLQRKAHENLSLLNIATLLNVAPNEQSVLQSIKQLKKDNEQLQQKIEYLKGSQPDVVYQKMLQHEQRLSQELQEVADRLIKELKQSKDDKQILLDELSNKEDQLKQLQQKSPSKSPYSSAKKLGSAQKYSSATKQTRFQQQFINTLQQLTQQVKIMFSEYVNQQDIQYDYEQLMTEDTQLLALNASNLVRDITQVLAHKEEVMQNYVQGLQIQLDQSQLLVNECKQLKAQSSQLSQIVQKARDTRTKEIERAFSSDIPVFVVPDDLMDSELQLTIEKHNSRVQQKLNDLAIQLKKKTQLCEQLQSQSTKMKIIAEEGVNRLTVVLNELHKMADSNEAQKMLKFCRNELDSLSSNLNSIEIDQSINNDIKQQRQNWLSQLDQMKKYYQDQVEKLLQENELINEKMDKLSQLSQGLHTDNEGMVRKLKQSQQDLLQMKEEKIALESEYDLTIRQFEESTKVHEQQEKKLRQTLELAERELDKQRKEFTTDVTQKQLEQQNLVEKYNDRIQVLEFENKTYKQSLENIEKDFAKLKQQRQAQEQLSETDKQSLRKQLDEKKKQLLTLQSENKKQHEEAITQIEELQDELNHISNQLQLKEAENKQLHKTLSELEDFSRKQIDVIRTYEDKLTEAYQIKKQLETSNEGNDQMLCSLQSKHTQLQQQYTQLKNENDKLLNDLSMLQKQYLKQMEACESEYKDKMSKQAEINKILKEEARNLKAQLELKMNQFRQSETELLDKNQELDKAQKICKQLNQQLTEFRQKVDYFENLKQDTASLSDQYNQQFQLLQAENFQYRKELERLQQQTSQRLKTNNMQDQAVNNEIINLKQEIRKMEQLLNQERLSFEQEIKNYQIQLGELNRSDLSLRQKSGQSGSSAFYEHLIEAKDLEIARLTGMMKSLTDLRK